MFFNVTKARPLGEDDICSFQEWKLGVSNERVCCRHDDGYLIFLGADKLNLSDEYKDGDPYGVSVNINSAFHTRRRENTIKLLTDLHLRDARILDLGCGEGHLTNEIKMTFPDAEVHGLDYAMSAIDYGHKHFKNIAFIVADAYYPPYADNSFDVVVLNNIWEHVPDPLVLLSAISRILKPHGYVVVSTPSRYRFSNLTRVLMGKPIRFMSKLHVTEYTIGQVQEQFVFGGYQVIRVYSTTIREHRWVVHAFKIFLSLFLKLVRSHHNLEATVFYVARKN